jgi:diaminohydroxyphosphoribosylaminopyrimidine deaminase/5-amino-6-(5-phosphoribosylamino)uracil reductase
MDYMAQALSLAGLALGQVSPNPAVGAVVVKEGDVVGQGYTQPPGADHAEIVALKQAGEKALGGVLYTTLEPCGHFGRTPPCTEAVARAGICEVHMAALDDNPLVVGRGKAALEAAGLKVYLGEHEAEARQLNEAYIKHITTGLPFVIAKYAMSLDGKIAATSGDSKWISSSEARQLAHNIRYTCDAIMVGANTVMADDPHLTARSGHGRGGTGKRQPLRVIVDASGRIPPTANVFSGPGGALLALGRPAEKAEKEAYAAVGAEVVSLPSEKGMVDLEKLLRYLAERDVTSLLVEGGGILLGSMFDLGLVDKVAAFIAPVIIGGGTAPTPVAGRGVDTVAEAIKLDRVSLTTLGDNIMVTGYVVKE